MSFSYRFQGWRHRGPQFCWCIGSSWTTATLYHVTDCSKLCCLWNCSWLLRDRLGGTNVLWDLLWARVQSRIQPVPVCMLVSDSVQPYGPTRLFRPWESLGKNTGLGCHALLQRTFPTQGSNPRRLLCLLHCRWILYCWATQEASQPVRTLEESQSSRRDGNE